MIQIERHIEKLLLNNDCVIVPNFGGFMAHHIEAYYDFNDGLYLPPLRTLGFNSQLRLNDSLLAQSYIETYDISYPEALQRIATDVEELKQRLSEYGSYQLEGIGTININSKGRYDFKPCEAGILTPSLYGFSSVEMPMLQKPAVQASKKLEVVTKEEQDEPAKVITIKVSTLRNIAAACIIGLAFMLFPAQLTTNKLQPQANSPFSKEMLQRVMPKDITTGKPKVTKIQEVTTKESIQEKVTTIEDDPVVPSETAPKTESYYGIVLASQVSKTNAANFIDQLKAKGFADGHVVSGKFVRVVYGHYASEQEAYNALRPLKGQSSAFAEGWIMKFEDSL